MTNEELQRAIQEAQELRAKAMGKCNTSSEAIIFGHTMIYLFPRLIAENERLNNRHNHIFCVHCGEGWNNTIMICKPCYLQKLKDLE